MVKRAAPRAKRAKAAGRGMRRGRMARRGGKKLASSEFASAKQTLVLLNDNVNLLYTLYDVKLADFDRLSQIAQCYQYFRITKIEYKLKPFADTFTSAGGNSVPYLLWLIDRNESFDFATNGFQQIRDAGVKPIRFDDKTINIRYKPSVLQTLPADGLNPPITQTFMNSRVSPWLPTNRYAGQETATYQWGPSIVPHRGIVYGVQQDLAQSPWEYGSELTIHVQFKKPAIVAKEGAVLTPAQPKSMVPKDDPVVVVPPVV